MFIIYLAYQYFYSKGLEETVEERRIRWNSLCSDNPNVHYNEGDYVEVKLRTTEDEPQGWWLAKITHRRDEFYFVHYENYDNIYDEIVMEDQIRPVNARGGMEFAKLKRHAIKVPVQVMPWCATPDWIEKFNSVISKTGVYNISFRPEDKEIVIVGESKPVDKATILTTFVIDHQVELGQLELENLKILKSIETKRHKIKGESVEEVLVPKELLGLIIGKSGANLTYVKQEYGVGIHILEHDSEDAKEFTNTDIPEDKALIRIYGKDPEWVTAAKSFMFLQRITYPIEADKIDYVKGYQNTIVNDIKEKSGCVKLFIHDPEKGSNEGLVEAIGNEEALERLQLLMDTHMEYYGTHQDKQNKNRELTKQASKYNTYGEAFYAAKPQGAPDARRRNKKY